MVAGELFKVEYRRSITGFGSHLSSGTSFQKIGKLAGTVCADVLLHSSNSPRRKGSAKQKRRGARFDQLQRALSVM
jgi:hypothetical protein